MSDERTRLRSRLWPTSSAQWGAVLLLLTTLYVASSGPVLAGLFWVDWLVYGGHASYSFIPWPVEVATSVYFPLIVLANWWPKLGEALHAYVMWFPTP